jgi:epsilon-lactone hydrolase
MQRFNRFIRNTLDGNTVSTRHPSQANPRSKNGFTRTAKANCHADPPLVSMPTNTEGWKALQKEADRVYENLAIAGAKQMNIAIESVKIEGVACYRVSPKSIAPGKENHIILHVHGGAFLFNGGLAAIGEAMILAEACQTHALSIDYRMPPDFPFPIEKNIVEILAFQRDLLSMI